MVKIQVAIVGRTGVRSSILLADDVPIGDLRATISIAAGMQAYRGRRDEDGVYRDTDEPIIYAIRSSSGSSGSAYLYESDTLRSAGVEPYSELRVDEPPPPCSIPDAVAFGVAAMASGVIGNVAYDVLKLYANRVREWVSDRKSELPSIDRVEVFALAAVIARCEALEWANPTKMKVVGRAEEKFGNLEVYRLEISCEGPVMGATVTLPVEQLSTAGAEVVLRRPLLIPDGF